MSNIFNNDDDDNDNATNTVSLSQEDRQNLDRLLTSSTTSPSNHSESFNSFDDLTSKSAYHIQTSSATLLNDSQMGFAFLKHKVYNYDGGFTQEESSDNKFANQKLNAHGLFENTLDNDANVIAETGQQNNNLFKEDNRSKKSTSKSSTSTTGQQQKNKIVYYQEFLDRLMLPKSQPICTAIK